MYLQVFTRLRGSYLYLQVFAKFATGGKNLQKHVGQTTKTSFNKYLQIEPNLKNNKNKFSRTEPTRENVLKHVLAYGTTCNYMQNTCKYNYNSNTYKCKNLQRHVFVALSRHTYKHKYLFSQVGPNLYLQPCTGVCRCTNVLFTCRYMYVEVTSKCKNTKTCKNMLSAKTCKNIYLQSHGIFICKFTLAKTFFFSHMVLVFARLHLQKHVSGCCMQVSRPQPPAQAG